jgi:acyl CoA:acetate/3-ketoacid CoA transferase alpha subunit
MGAPPTVGGFMAGGTPEGLQSALVVRGVGGLAVIANSAEMPYREIGWPTAAS